MSLPTFEFKSKIWLYDGPAAWHFITIPKGLSKDIKAMAGSHRGFGSVRVEITIGQTTWQSSIFPEKTGNYVLPVKAGVRKTENLRAGQSVQVKLTIL